MVGGADPVQGQNLWGAPGRRSLAAWERMALAGELRVWFGPHPKARKHFKHGRYPEFFHGREWAGVTWEAFAAEVADHMDWFVNGRPMLFEEGGRRFYETPAAHRRRHGYPVPSFGV